MKNPTFYNMSTFIQSAGYPKPIQRIMRALSLLTFLSMGLTLASKLFSIQQILALSSWGTGRSYLWQVLSYPLATSPFSLRAAVELAFQLFFIRFLLLSLYQQKKGGPLIRFLVLSLTSGGIGGFITFFLSDASLVTSTVHGLVFPMAALAIGMAMVWSQVPWIKWGIAITLGMVIFSDWEVADAPFLVTLGATSLTAYFYTTLAWNLRSPFRWTHGLDDWLGSIGTTLRRWIFRSRALTHHQEK